MNWVDEARDNAEKHRLEKEKQKADETRRYDEDSDKFAEFVLAFYLQVQNIMDQALEGGVKVSEPYKTPTSVVWFLSWAFRDNFATVSIQCEVSDNPETVFLTYNTQKIPITSLIERIKSDLEKEVTKPDMKPYVDPNPGMGPGDGVFFT